MPLPRFRLRTLMIAVAVVAALCFCGVWMRRRSDEFRRLAFFHAAMSNGAMMDAVGFEGEKGHEAQASEAAAAEAYHLGMTRMYERLVSHPWESPPFDPLAAQSRDWEIPPTPMPQY